MSKPTDQQKNNIEKALWDLVKIKNENIFDFITTSIAHYLETDFAFISILPEFEREQVKTVSFFADGKLADTYHYQLEKTPCALVVTNSNIISYEKNVRHEFPMDEDLKTMNIQSYIGASLTDSTNKVIGLMSIMSHEPCIIDTYVKKIFEVYRSRASIELARLIQENVAKKAEQKLLGMLDKDSLTKLPNHSSLMEALSHIIKEDLSNTLQASVLYIDIDDFKKINDCFGHIIGDQVLVEITRRLLKLRRKDDFIARVGGDEFILIAKKLDNENHAGQIAKRIISKLSRTIVINRNSIKVNVSIGIAPIHPKPGISTSAFIEYADVAMYEAKTTGKNCFKYFTKTLEAHYKRKQIIANLLASALEKKEFSLVYQPIMNITNNTLLGVEALLRWNCSELEHVGPDEFIPIAEEKNLILAIGDFVFLSACEQLKLWNKQTKNDSLKLNINFSPLQLAYHQADKHILSILEKHKSLKKQLVFELTESVIMEKKGLALDTLNTLVKAGISFALDDFGTGYSSLSYLIQISITYLKIDKSFIDKITESSDSRAIIQSTIKLGEVLKINIVAEGVETQDQLDFLKQYGCKFIQGNYLYKPMSVKEISTLICNPSSK